MRISLEEGRQKEFIFLAKRDRTWKELAKKLKINHLYLSNELGKEKRLLSNEVYSRLCKIVGKNFDEFIIERKDDNWGRSKGGVNSPGSTKRLPKIDPNRKLAEFIGAVLGDGNINSFKREGRVGVYQIKIAGDLVNDRDYHLNYLKDLCKEIFDIEAKEIILSERNERFLAIYSKELVGFLNNMGLKAGNKIRNQLTIPEWIIQEDDYLKACLRGLIDTDGSIHRMSRKDPSLIRINFKNYNKRLIEDTRKSFIKLGFSPSKIILGKIFYLSRQEEIKKYLKDIGFSNKKHLDRAKKFSLVV